MSRSVSFKSDHNRGFAREKDRTSHHSHRNVNRGIDEDSTFIPFNKDFKREGFKLEKAHQRSNVGNSTDDLISFFRQHTWMDWRETPLKQYLTKASTSKNLTSKEKHYAKDTLKQFNRRGAASRFVGHDRFSDKVELWEVDVPENSPATAIRCGTPEHMKTSVLV